jgi:hypothetical protein
MVPRTVRLQNHLTDFRAAVVVVAAVDAPATKWHSHSWLCVFIFEAPDE